MCLNKGHDHHIPKLLPSCMVIHNNTGLVRLWEYGCLKAHFASYVSSRYSPVGYILCSNLLRNKENKPFPLTRILKLGEGTHSLKFLRLAFVSVISVLFMLQLPYSLIASSLSLPSIASSKKSCLDSEIYCSYFNFQYLLFSLRSCIECLLLLFFFSFFLFFSSLLYFL